MNAIYPGSFDPITLGHVDIIERSSRMFSELIVLVAVNPDKRYLFSVEERVKLITNSISHFPNVEVDTFTGLTVDYARQRGAPTLIRGLRAVSDFEKELQMAHTNKSLWRDLETVFLTTSTEYSFLSSSVVKEVSRYGGRVDHLVPPNVERALREKFREYL